MNWLPDFDGGLSLWMFVAFGAIAFLHLFYVFYFYARLAFFRQRKMKLLSEHELPPVSVIISARNEEDNLQRFLPQLLEQDYPNFEVIVVNHQSVDDSYHVLNELQKNYPHLRVLEIERSRHLGAGKKLPITLAVKAARFEHFVLTDADCVPQSKQWLRRMAERFTSGKELVLGYGPYEVRKGILNKLIRFDTAMIAVNYLSFAMARLAYMGVGRNLAYTKEVFYRVDGFKSHYALSSGDDDLFVQEAARSKNVAIQVLPESFCLSAPKETWADWFKQKTRHYTTTERYGVIKKALLGIYPLTVLLLWVSFVILLLNAEYRWLTLMVFALVIVLKWWIQGKALMRLKSGSFVALFPLNDLLYALIMPFVYYSSDKSEKQRWK